jgi:hypothetical protein
MNNKRGWRRIIIVLAIFWLIFCGFGYYQSGLIAVQSQQMFMNYGDEKYIEAMLDAIRAQENIAWMSFMLPLTISVIGGVVVWVRRGFMPEDQDSE